MIISNGVADFSSFIKRLYLSIYLKTERLLGEKILFKISKSQFGVFCVGLVFYDDAVDFEV